MNKDIIELVKRNDKYRLEISEYKSFIKVLKDFLSVSNGAFVLEDSLASLERLKEFLNSAKLKYSNLVGEQDKVNYELSSICTHDVLFQNYDQFVCPLCGYWFWKSDNLFNKYLIECEDLHMLSEMENNYFDFLINFNGDDIGTELLILLEDFIRKFDVKVLRR